MHMRCEMLQYPTRLTKLYKAEKHLLADPRAAQAVSDPLA